MKKFFLLALLFSAGVLSALECAKCGRMISGNYIKTPKAAYCSRRCFRQTLPQCVRCGNACERSVLTFMNKTFCSKKCMELTFRCAVCNTGLSQALTIVSPAGKMMVCTRCSRLPGCYFCALPCGCPALADGRHICDKCRKTAVVDPAEVRQLFFKIRRDLGKLFGFDPKHRIRLVMVNARTLERLSKSTYSSEGSRRLALMSYKKEVTERKRLFGKKERFVSSEQCSIYVLDTTPKAVLIDALAHELTHDHLRHRIGSVKDLAAEEGFCELIAFLYNRQIGNKKLNLQKEVNKDPVYGGGFRKMREIYNRTRSLSETMRHIR